MDITFSEKDQRKLQMLGVQAMYLFGSRAQGAEGPLSDFDFAFLMDKAGYKRGGETYDQLYEMLSPYCKRTLANDVIDIVFLRDVPLELSFHVIRYGKVLFDADPKLRADFEDKTGMEYCDYRPILEMFDRAILAAI